jgi:monoamine oxidase
MSQEMLDVAIVGGGVSGVYTAWRLLTTKGGPKQVKVFEAGNHVGGRLLSAKPPFIDNMRAELGGMRILPAVQPRIQKLIATLNQGAKPADRIETYPFPVDQPGNISYLRGTHLRLSDFTSDPSKVPYRLTFQEFGQTAGALVVNAISQLLPGITDPKLTDAERRAMTQAASFDGEPLYRQGFWQLLLRVMSDEAYQLGIAAGGYETTLSNWNAADAIPWFLSDFGVEPVYEGFRQGFQQVPLTLAKRVVAAGGEILTDRPLVGFSEIAGGIELQFRGGETVRTRHLVLAMPRRALDLLAPNSAVLREEAVNQLIRSVTPRPLFKVFTTYMEPWWLPAGVEAGRTTTDLPVRQTYYWPKDDGKPAVNGRAMLMASYDDGMNIGFWDGFRPKHGVRWSGKGDNRKVPTAWFEGELAKDDDPDCKEWYENRAPKAMVAEIQRQIAMIHGLKFVPKVEDASFKDWGDDPFGGGWNSWNIGVRSPEVKEQILKPASAPVYICGEAYSDAQGWVEGALQTADMMLEAWFEVPVLSGGGGGKKPAKKAAKK